MSGDSAGLVWFGPGPAVPMPTYVPNAFTTAFGGITLVPPSQMIMSLSDADIERIARRVAEILREGKP